MLRKDLLEIVNRGDAWALIGSGPSVDAGGPSWSDLVQGVVASADSVTQHALERDTAFRSARSHFNYPACFTAMERVLGRSSLEQSTRQQLAGLTDPSLIVQELADWPFAGYLTTNYDDLIWTALERAGQTGWTRVGNSPDEVRQVSGDAQRVIWHIHGATALDGSQSRLILTTEDYASLYPQSPITEQIRGLLSFRRIVVIGFGFRDEALRKLLEVVGSLTSPARPLLAFAPLLGRSNAAKTRRELLTSFNVDVIPYIDTDGSHRQLKRTLELYGSLVLRRSLRFNQPGRSVPSYHPETTGLLLYNRLRLERGIDSPNVREMLLRSRVVARLKYEGACPQADLVTDLSTLAAGVSEASTATSDAEMLVTSVITDLLEEGICHLVEVDSVSLVELTTAGEDLVSEHAAAGIRLGRQFLESLRSRAKGAIGRDGESAERVAKAVEAFLKSCIRRRALGVAMATMAPMRQHQEFQIVALLQALPEHMSTLASTEEGLAMDRVVQDVLARPNEVEQEYIGLTLQAVFAVHVLGYDSATLGIRANMFRDTVFLADATLLIQLLAAGSEGHAFARFLADRLQAMGARIATTRLLAEEVAEHARWALTKVDPSSGGPNIETYMVATGRAGDRGNEFITGFLELVYSGTCPPNLTRYLELCFGRRLRQRSTCSTWDVTEALRAVGIYCEEFSSWPGYEADLLTARNVNAQAIGRIRQQNGTYTHQRQVTAEAEALILTQEIRNGRLQIPGYGIQGAYFLSNTRIIDSVAQAGTPITMRPSGVLQWCATLNPCSIDELRVLTNGLLAELSRSEFTVVDRSRILSVFEPLISASVQQLDEVKTHHRTLLSYRYGEGSVEAFARADAIDAPAVAESLNVQRIAELEQQVKQERARSDALSRQAELSESEREELAKLRAAQQARRRRAGRQRRAADSRRGRRRRENEK